MLYSEHITIPKNTTEIAPERKHVKVNKGVVYNVWVVFPPGCAGLVSFRMYYGGHPFLPVNRDAYIKGDNYVYQFPLYEAVEESPGDIVIEAWNDDDTYSHTLSFQILILPKDIVYPSILIYQAIESLIRTLV